MGKLSVTAQVILASHFALGDGTVLTMGNEVSRMTERCREAMSELIMEGIIVAAKADDGRAESMTYRLTDKGKATERRKPSSWMDKHGKFPFTEKIV
jgi:predicted ArsR family transcriptional regulator